MELNVGLIIVVLAAFCGGILAAFLGWLDSKEPFDSRKFGKSVGMALISAIGFGVGYSFADTIGAKDIFIAILAGAGVDVIANRAIGASKI